MIGAAAWGLVATGLAMAGLGLYRLKRRRDVRQRRARGVHWSIGCERSANPLSWRGTPEALLTRAAIGPRAFNLADPFLLDWVGSRWLFFEVMERDADRARIDVARWELQSRCWRPQGTALAEDFHLSYPHVFEHAGAIYMLPETKQAGSVRLYRAHDFPRDWRLEAELLHGCKLVDPTPLFWEGWWYCFASRRRTLHLFVAEALTGPWRPHPRSPVRRRNYARCAGRILVHGGVPYRFAQEQRRYGAGVHAFRIDSLTPTAFKETPIDGNPLLAPSPSGSGWNAEAMHHLDVLKESDGTFFAVYDGEGESD